MKKLIAIILTLAFILCTVSTLAEDYGEFYPLLTIVVGWETIGHERVISCADRHGNIWQFYDDENFWKVGDLCNLLMWRGVEYDSDDEVIETYYEGTLTPTQTARFLR